MLDEKVEHAVELDESMADRPHHVSLKPRWLPHTLIEQIEILSKVALLIGAVIAAREYFDRRDDMRVSRTLEFVTRFDAPEYLGPRQAIGRSLSDKARELRGQTAAEGGEKQSPDVIAARAEKAALSIVLDGNEGKGLETEVGQIASFFSSLEICVEQKICDSKTAHSVFDSYAQSFWQAFQPYFRDVRLSTPQAGVGLEKFVGGSK